MPLHLTGHDIALRLALALVAGAVIGFNRGEHSRPAGLRTTMLMCLAAAVAMIQANLMLDTSGKTEGSFVQLDVMRLPLGILSGMGFIGAGAILRKGNHVLGITTAATLWLVTVIGLAIGGGQIELGLAALALAVIILWGLEWVEHRLPREKRITLGVTIEQGGPSESEIRRRLIETGFKVANYSIVYLEGKTSRRFQFELRWQARPHELPPSTLANSLATETGVQDVEWRPAESMV